MKELLRLCESSLHLVRELENVLVPAHDSGLDYGRTTNKHDRL